MDASRTGPHGAGDERASRSRHDWAWLPPAQSVRMAPQCRPAAPKPVQRSPVQQVPLRRSVGTSWHNFPRNSREGSYQKKGFSSNHALMNQQLDCRRYAYEERTSRRSPTGNGRCKDRPGQRRESPDAPAVVHAAKEPLGLHRFPGAPLSRRLHDFCGGMIGDGGAPRLQQSEMVAIRVGPMVQPSPSAGIFSAFTFMLRVSSAAFAVPLSAIRRLRSAAERRRPLLSASCCDIRK
jgi:hypothetical protein